MSENQKFLHVVDGHKKTDFSFFGWGHFLIHDIWKKWPKNDPSQKKFLHPKIRSLIHFNHTKKFQKSMFFPTFIARALPWLRPTIFKAKCLRMVSINSEYLNLSMVEPAPENLAPWLLYWRGYQWWQILFLTSLPVYRAFKQPPVLHSFTSRGRQSHLIS